MQISFLELTPARVLSAFSPKGSDMFVCRQGTNAKKRKAAKRTR